MFGTFCWRVWSSTSYMNKKPMGNLKMSTQKSIVFFLTKCVLLCSVVAVVALGTISGSWTKPTHIWIANCRAGRWRICLPVYHREHTTWAGKCTLCHWLVSFLQAISSKVEDQMVCNTWMWNYLYHLHRGHVDYFHSRQLCLIVHWKCCSLRRRFTVCSSLFFWYALAWVV